MTLFERKRVKIGF